jgi:hypothetical protein
MEIDIVSDHSPVSADEADAGKDGAASTQQFADPLTAVRDATVDFNILQRCWMRRRLRYGAWCAEWTGGDYGRDGFDKFFNENAYRFGEKIKEHLPSGLQQQLKGFIDGGGELFLIVRGVFSRRVLQQSFTKALEDDPSYPSRKIVGYAATKLLDENRYNLIASGLIAATGAELRQKLVDNAVYHDFITATGAEKNPFVNDPDMYLRYRTANPGRPLAASSDGKAARIILFACVENPIADPIYLIRADEVVSRLLEEHRRLLREASFCFFDDWDPATLVRNRLNEAKRILYDGPSETDPWLSFDPQSFDPEYERTTAAQLSAVAALMASIRKTGATSARKIVLRRGDALIVDNYRALTRRYEQGHTYFNFRPLGRPPIRWLRIYRGYPKR